MKAAGKPTDKPNMVCGPVQVCWHKFAKYWDIELREIPLGKDHLAMTPEEIRDSETLIRNLTASIRQDDPAVSGRDAAGALAEQLGEDVIRVI